MKRADAAIVDLEGEDAAPPGHDRRRATLLAFALCLAVGSAGVGRDGPEATQPREDVTARPAMSSNTAGLRIENWPAGVPSTRIYDRTGTELRLIVMAPSAREWLRVVPADSTR